MVKGKLVMAMDFAKSNDVPHKTESFFCNGVWRVAKRGPGFCNVFQIEEYDDAGLQWLKSKLAKQDPPKIEEGK